MFGQGLCVPVEDGRCAAVEPGGLDLLAAHAGGDVGRSFRERDTQLWMAGGRLPTVERIAQFARALPQIGPKDLLAPAEILLQVYESLLDLRWL